MIYLHRKQTLNKDLNNYGYEIDFRYLADIDELVISHDYSNVRNFSEFNNLLNSDNMMIADIKESGLEEKIIKTFGFRDNIFFLDSQIPDIVRLCKTDDRYLGKFIIRVSDYEPFSKEFVTLTKPKKYWIDIKMCEDYITLINIIQTCHISLFGKTPEIILTAPDVFGHINTDEIIKFKNDIKSYDVSICTKSPEIFEL